MSAMRQGPCYDVKNGCVHACLFLTYLSINNSILDTLKSVLLASLAC